MLFKLFLWLRGYLLIETKGFFAERFINLCMYNKIYLWDIKKKEKNISEMKISVKGFKRIENVSKKTGTSIRIIRKCGLPLILHRYRKRYAFIEGALMFLLIIFTLSSFLWSIEITGCEKIEENRIRNALTSCGISPGVVKYNIEASEVKEQMLELIPELSWCWVKIQGTRAICEVREKTPVPDIVPADVPCNIVAKKSGIIQKVNVKQGEALVADGAVYEGELLVSGVMELQNEGVRFVHADGEVWADTSYEKEEIFPLSFTEDIKTGKSVKRRTLKIGSLDINLWFGKEHRYERCEVSEKTSRAKLWGDFYLPVAINTKEFFETEEITNPLTEAEAETFYGEKLKEELLKEISDKTQILSADFGHTLNDDGTITLKCTILCREDIAKKIQIEKGQ